MRYDVAIIGAGPAGMIAMARFAAAGFHVLGLEQRPDIPLDASDLRSTAFLMPSIETLEKAELWSALAPWSTPLDVMEIVDASRVPPHHVTFHAGEINQPHFGHNIMNAKMHSILREHIHHHPNIELRFETHLTALMQFDEYVSLRLTNQEELQTRLLVGADGRHSKLREMLGIEADIQTLDQWAQVCTLTHEKPHQNTSTEIHLKGGPFTLVPTQDIDGQPASALVWMDKHDNVLMRETLSEEAFEAEMNSRSFGVRGTLKKVSPLGAFPMVMLEAKELSLHRCVIIGEASHVVPPIGAQGLNMSLRDIESLVKTVERGGLENPKYIKNWARNRKMDITIRERGIGLLNQVSIGDIKNHEKLRQFGMQTLEKQSPLRRGLMRLGLGSS